MEDGVVELDNVHPELHTSTLEAASNVRADLSEARAEMRRLRREVRDLAAESGLGVRAEVEHAYRVLEEGTSADRQLEIYRKSRDFGAVVEQLVAETAGSL